MLRAAEGLSRTALVCLVDASKPTFAPGAGATPRKRRSRPRGKKGKGMADADMGIAGEEAVDPSQEVGTQGAEASCGSQLGEEALATLGPRWSAVDAVAGPVHGATGSAPQVPSSLPGDLAEIQRMSNASGPEASRIFAQLLGKMGYKGKGIGGGKVGDFGRGGRPCGG